jgi:hypothetical protein
MWLRELAQFGCPVDECEAVLRDIEVIDPQAVARCREAGAWWRLDAG